MKEMFVDVLEKGEEIQKVFKPNKCKTAWFWILTSFWSLIWILVIPIGFLFEGEGSGAYAGRTFWIAFGICIGVIVLCTLILIIAGMLWYKNRFFAYTDRRILIRGGIIGIDYKSLEFKSLTATVVNVSLLDKLVRKNTGSIKFGSAASPVLSIWSGHSNQYIFQHLEKPYDVLREIKEYMSDHKEVV